MSSHIGRFVESFKFSHPCSLLISGTTGAGKSHYVKRLVEKIGIKGDIRTIYYFMPKLESIDIAPPPNQEIFMLENLPTRQWVDDNFKNGKGKALLIFDDLWAKCVESPVIEYLVTFGRRHLNLSMCFLAQNFYEKSKKAITIRNCQTAFILFSNSTDASMNKTICTKLGEQRAYKAAMQLFRDRQVVQHSYIVIRKDITNIYQPRVYTNMFGTVPNLGPLPWIFDMPK